VEQLHVKVVDWAADGQVVLDTEFWADAQHVSVDSDLDFDGSSDLEVTVLGFREGEDQPILFARMKNLVVAQGEETVVDLMEARYADYCCVETPGGAANRMFHTATQLPDGRFFIAGGFTKTSEETGRFEAGNSSDQGFVVDLSDGTVAQSANLMNRGRGAHAAVYLPKSGLVLLVGGIQRLYREKNNECFPWYWEKDNAGDAGLTYELFDPAALRFLDWDSDDWPDEGHEMVTPVRRVFPAAVLNNDGTVLVTGGGYWPSCGTDMETDADYRIAELYRPRSDNYTGGFQESYGALTMKAVRSGHSGVLLEVKDALTTHLYWGGSVDGALAELYQESSGQMDGNFGAFKEVTWLDSSAYNKRPYFHTMTVLKGRTFLLAGGTAYSSGKLRIPSAADAYQIRVTDDQEIGVNTVDGLGLGRYFHSATTLDGARVVVYGGFSSELQDEETVFAAAAVNDVRFFDLNTEELGAAIVDVPGAFRAGHTASVLPNETLLLIGGVDELHLGLEFQKQSVGLLADLYCPSVVCPEDLWDQACYPD